MSYWGCLHDSQGSHICLKDGLSWRQPDSGGLHMGVVRVRRRGCPSRQGACLAGGACTCAITFSSRTLFAAFSSSTCKKALSPACLWAPEHVCPLNISFPNHVYA